MTYLVGSFCLLLLFGALVAYIVYDLRNQRDFWRERATASDDAAQAAQDKINSVLTAARAYELQLFDQALKRHGAQPIAQPPPEPKPAATRLLEKPLDPVAYNSIREVWEADYVEDAQGRGVTDTEELARIREQAGRRFDQMHGVNQ